MLCFLFEYSNKIVGKTLNITQKNTNKNPEVAYKWTKITEKQRNNYVTKRIIISLL